MMHITPTFTAKSLLFVMLGLIFVTACETDDNGPASVNELTVKFANRFGSAYDISGFWVKTEGVWKDESLIPSGQTLEPGRYFTFHLPKKEDVVSYRVSVVYDGETVILDRSSMGTELGISTFVGEDNTRYARIRVTGTPPGVTAVGCSTIPGGDFWNSEYTSVSW